MKNFFERVLKTLSVYRSALLTEIKKQGQKPYSFHRNISIQIPKCCFPLFFLFTSTPFLIIDILMFTSQKRTVFKSSFYNCFAISVSKQEVYYCYHFISNVTKSALLWSQKKVQQTSSNLLLHDPSSCFWRLTYL